MSDPLAVFDPDNFDRLEFPRCVARIRDRRSEMLRNARALRSDEISRLETQGNHAGNWGAIRVAERFSTDHIHDNRFFGNCFLGCFSGVPGADHDPFPFPSGIYDSIVFDSVIGNESRIVNVRGMRNYFIDENAAVYNTGTLACAPETVFGNGREIVIGIETGGREVLALADMTVALAWHLSVRRETEERYRKLAATYMDRVRIGFGVVETGCRIGNCPCITDAYLGAGAWCDHATLLANSTVLSSAEEPVRIGGGAYVRNSCLQWGSHVDSMAIVDDSLLTEHSHVERHGKVTHSIVGPNTGIAEGEVTASLVGPFVGFHHQSLLIGALWPEGKGNVAYGANVGSNHTSKAPDQEILCGEGMFFGLGSNIKFPADYSRAPYSIVATGVTTLPQRISFPFSLINAPSHRFDGVSPAYNEIIPGWVLSDNLYMVQRNEGKFRKRNKARRSTFISDVFRPDIVDMMIRARDVLRDVTPGKELYLQDEIPGLGKNYLTGANLLKSIETYSTYIERYCLDGLFERCNCVMEAGIGEDELMRRALGEFPEPRFWNHQLRAGIDEGYFSRSVKTNLERYLGLIDHSASAILSAKKKDDIRGTAIMGDYTSVHGDAEEDGFVAETQKKAEELRCSVSRMMELLTH